jgi:hypothetical protein
MELKVSPAAQIEEKVTEWWVGAAYSAAAALIAVITVFLSIAVRALKRARERKLKNQLAKEDTLEEEDAAEDATDAKAAGDKTKDSKTTEEPSKEVKWRPPVPPKPVSRTFIRAPESTSPVRRRAVAPIPKELFIPPRALKPLVVDVCREVPTPPKASAEDIAPEQQPPEALPLLLSADEAPISPVYRPSRKDSYSCRASETPVVFREYVPRRKESITITTRARSISASFDESPVRAPSSLKRSVSCTNRPTSLGTLKCTTCNRRLLDCTCTVKVYHKNRPFSFRNATAASYRKSVIAQEKMRYLNSINKEQ